MQKQTQTCPPLNLMPYVIISKGLRFTAQDTRTGNEGLPRLSRIEAEQDAVSLKIRNLMHS